MIVRLGTAAVLLSVLVSAGCSGGGDDAEPTATPPSTPRASLTSFIEAVRARDEAAMWRVLSRASRARLGPSFAEFRSAGARELVQEVGSFRAGYKVILVEQITLGFAVAAVAGERAIEARREYGAYAAALRREQGEWRLALRDPIRLRILRPEPGEEVRRRTQLAAEISAGAPIEEAGLWFDGMAFPTRGGGVDDRHLTMFGEAPPLTRGYHTVVAFSSAGDSAAAVAWAFSVTQPAPDAGRVRRPPPQGSAAPADQGVRRIAARALA